MFGFENSSIGNFLVQVEKDRSLCKEWATYGAYELEQNDRNSLKQKSRVKWAVEGDENQFSSYLGELKATIKLLMG